MSTSVIGYGIRLMQELNKMPVLAYMLFSQQFLVPVKNRCVTYTWATLWMSRSGTSLSVSVEILGCKGSSIGLLQEMTVGRRHKGVPPPAFFNWRGWFRAGIPFFQGNMTNALNSSSWISTGGSPYPKPLPRKKHKDPIRTRSNS
ncbi:hypothetical protein J6590_003684 [Homalodisca vitripennis]|nr:hypothetical protein J6590_003684 [Homalodisca vitripennis]